MREITVNELEQVGGAWGPAGAAIGAAGGMGGYFLNNKISGAPWSWTDFGTAAISGAAAGGVAGPAGVIWRFNAAIAGGTASGIAQHYGW